MATGIQPWSSGTNHLPSSCQPQVNTQQHTLHQLPGSRLAPSIHSAASSLSVQSLYQDTSSPTHLLAPLLLPLLPAQPPPGCQVAAMAYRRAAAGGVRVCGCGLRVVA